MELDELRKQLYKKDGQLSDRPQPPEEFKAGHLSTPSTQTPSPKWAEAAPQSFSLKVKQKL